MDGWMSFFGTDEFLWNSGWLDDIEDYEEDMSILQELGQL